MGKKGSAKNPQSSGFVNEKRVDPADGHQLTWEELQQKYAMQYSAFQIGHYWYNECKRVPKAAAKANVKPEDQAEREAAAKAEIEEEAAAKAKAEQEAAMKAKAEQESAAKAKAEQEAAVKAKIEEEAAAKVKAEQEAAVKAKIEEEAAAKEKAEQEAAVKAKIEQEAVAKAKAEQELAELTKNLQVAEDAAFLRKLEEKAEATVAAANAHAEEEAAAKAPEVVTSNANSDAASQGEVKAHKKPLHLFGPLWSSFIVWLGEFNDKFCKGACTGARVQKENAVDMPLRQHPEELVGA